MAKITIVDSIMGSGKTSWAIRKMNEETDRKFVYITPYLSEVARIKEKCVDRKFFDPKNVGSGKLDSMHNLLSYNKNIASTHALFQSANETTRNLIAMGNYTLILDEVMNVVDFMDMKKGDIVLMKEHDLIRVEEDGLVTWNEDKLDFDTRYNDIKAMCQNKTVYLIGDTVLIWTFPVDIFDSFQEVYVLTYKFKGQLQRYYYDMSGVEFDYKSVYNEDGKYTLGEYREFDDMDRIKSLITLYQGNFNNIGDKPTALSKTFYKSASKEVLKTFQRAIYSYFHNYTRSKSQDNMWTTFKDYKGVLSGKGYTNGFVSVGTRATNEYKDKKFLAFCVNEFHNPIITNFFQRHGVTDLNEDVYALSELIQWIWRSQIRDGKQITCYIPSKRMRDILLNWLNE